eukprot:s3059_g6.t1
MCMKFASAGDLALCTPNMRLSHLAQVANGLSRGLDDTAAREQLLTKLAQVLRLKLKLARDQISRRDLTELQRGDIEALMSSLFWLPPGSRAAQLLPELLRSILQGGSVDERLSPRAKVILYKCYQTHRYFQDVLQDLSDLLLKAAEGSPPWAVTEPQEYQKRMEDICSEILALEDGMALDAPEWEVSAAQMLERLLEVPFLEAHPVPDRERTSGFASWALSCLSRVLLHVPHLTRRMAQTGQWSLLSHWRSAIQGATKNFEGMTVEELQAMKDEYKKSVNPSGEVPSLKTKSGDIITESEILAEYFDMSSQTSTHKLVPSDPVKASHMRLAMKKFNDVIPGLFGLLRNQDPAKDQEWADKINASMQKFRSVLDAEGRFCVGGAVSLADVTLAHYRDFQLIQDPRISELLEAVRALPEFQNGNCPDEDIIANYAFVANGSQWGKDGKSFEDQAPPRALRHAGIVARAPLAKGSSRRKETKETSLVQTWMVTQLQHNMATWPKMRGKLCTCTIGNVEPFADQKD